MDDYLTKPVRGRDIRASVSRWLAPGKNLRWDRKPPVVQEMGERRGLDREVLKELDDELEGDISLIVNAFLKKLPPRMAAIREAVEKNDPRLLERTAHLLKGTSRQLGANHLADLTAQLENLGRSNTMEGAIELFEKLESEAPRIEEALLKEMGG